MAMPGTVNGQSLTLGSGSVFAFNVQNAQGPAGRGYDTTHASGTLTLAAGTAAGSQITISVASLNSGGTAGPASNFDPSRDPVFVSLLDQLPADARQFKTSATSTPRKTGFTLSVEIR